MEQYEIASTFLRLLLPSDTREAIELVLVDYSRPLVSLVDALCEDNYLAEKWNRVRMHISALGLYRDLPHVLALTLAPYNRDQEQV